MLKMKNLAALVESADVIEIIGVDNVPISSLCCNNDNVCNSSLFIENDNEKIHQAISSGSTAIICEKFPLKLSKDITYVKVKSIRHAKGMISTKFYDHPSTKLQLVAVTGTTGKTTTVSFLYQLFRHLGVKVGLISSMYYKINEKQYPVELTAPDAIYWNAFLAMMVEEECRYCFLEVSSQNLDEGHLIGVEIAGAVFTNLSMDHLDHHQNYETYRRAKKSLFDNLDEGAFAIANFDDDEASYMLSDTKASKFFFSMKSPSDFMGEIFESSFEHLKLRINSQDFSFNVSGHFNAYNLLATYAVVRCLNDDADERELLKSVQSVWPIEGRFQVIITNVFTVVVDYARTPKALRAVLTSVNDLKKRDSRVILVFGCEGHRDKNKRSSMAKIGVELSDTAILTSDNPEFENPDVIINEMMAGLEEEQRQGVIRIIDRRQAMATALLLARDWDVVVVAGRGHQYFQLIRGKKKAFKDFQVIRELIKELNSSKEEN